jgi:hypothetical protein
MLKKSRGMACSSLQVMAMFVLPGAIVGTYMQTVRARPTFGALLFALIVIAVPFLLWSAGLTGVFAHVTGGR